VSTVQKINSMAGHSLWIDTGDPATDAMLMGYMRVVTGYDEEVVCRVAGGADREE
jgi:predicted polyphosphate/ATP-dependent NAD kinase